LVEDALAFQFGFEVLGELEEGVFQGILGLESGFWVDSQHFSQQRKELQVLFFFALELRFELLETAVLDLVNQDIREIEVSHKLLVLFLFTEDLSHIYNFTFILAFQEQGLFNLRNHDSLNMRKVGHASGLRLKQHLPEMQFVEDAPERPHVDCGSERKAQGDFRRAVGAALDVVVGRVAGSAGRTEVDDLHGLRGTVLKHDVVGFQVAVQEVHVWHAQQTKRDQNLERTAFGEIQRETVFFGFS